LLKDKYQHSAQISSEFLLPFNGFEQRFEVSSTEPGEIIALDDFNKDRWPIHEVL
jgi:hypothetical protein